MPDNEKQESLKAPLSPEDAEKADSKRKKKEKQKRRRQKKAMKKKLRKQKNLLSTMNNEIDCSPSALGLASGEYVTEFRIVFDEVQPEFHCTTGPAVQVKVLESVQNGRKFVNKVDAGGRYIKEWVYDSDGWTSTTFQTDRGDLPRTGW